MISLSPATTAMAASTQLSTYDGKVTTDFGFSLNDYAYAVAIQSDGKIVVAGGTGDFVARPIQQQWLPRHKLRLRWQSHDRYWE